MASFKKNAFSVFVSFSPEYHCFVWWLGDDDNDNISHRFFQGVPYRCCFIFTIYKKEYPIYPSFEQSLKLFENQIAISFNRSYRRPSYLVSFHLIFFKSSFFFHPAFRLHLVLNHSVEWRRRLPFQYLLKLNILLSTCWKKTVSNKLVSRMNIIGSGSRKQIWWGCLWCRISVKTEIYGNGPEVQGHVECFCFSSCSNLFFL